MRIGLISDIHEDIINLQKAFRLLETEKCDELICLGDIVGYHTFFDFENERDAEQCVKLVKANCSIVVLGNHDLNAAQIVPPELSGYELPQNWYSLSYTDKLLISHGELWLYENEIQGNISDKSIDYLRNIPFTEKFIRDNHSFLASHSVEPNLYGIHKQHLNLRFVFGEHFALLEQNNCNTGICGHTHPDGLIFGNSHTIMASYYGTLQLNRMEKSFISVPAVVRSQRTSGCAWIDTKTMEVKTLKIN